MRKTAILTSVAGLLLMTAPAAFAQDPAPQTPPAPDAAASPTVSLQPGASVKGSDGSTLGTLEGARQGPSGQEITVRGTDGQLRGVPVAGLTQTGADVNVAWSSSQFTAAPAIGATSDPATAPTDPVPSEGPPPAPTDDTSAEPEAADPAAPPPVEEPTTPGETPPTTPPTPQA